MYFNCSFPHNVTVEQDCCNLEAHKAFSVDISPDNSTAWCSTSNGTILTTCLAEGHRVFSPECLVQEVAREATVATQSSARRSSLSFLACAFLVLIGFTSLLGVAADDSKAITCKEFAPGDRSLWTTGMSVAFHISVTQDCRSQQSLCVYTPALQPIWNLTWDAPEGVNVKADPKKLVKTVGNNSVAAVKLPDIDTRMYLDSVGYMAASVQTTVVSGMFRQCDDGKEYNGTAAVPRTDVFSIRVVQDSYPKGGLSDTVSLPSVTETSSASSSTS